MVLVRYSHCFEVALQSFRRVAVQVAATTNLVFSMYVRLVLSAARTSALATIHYALAILAVSSIGFRDRFAPTASGTFYLRKQYRSPNAKGAEASALFHEPLLFAASTAGGLRLLPVANLANHLPEQHSLSPLATAHALHHGPLSSM